LVSPGGCRFGTGCFSLPEMFSDQLDVEIKGKSGTIVWLITEINE